VEFRSTSSTAHGRVKITRSTSQWISGPRRPRRPRHRPPRTDVSTSGNTMACLVLAWVNRWKFPGAIFVSSGSRGGHLAPPGRHVFSRRTKAPRGGLFRGAPNKCRLACVAKTSGVLVSCTSNPGPGLRTRVLVLPRADVVGCCCWRSCLPPGEEGLPNRSRGWCRNVGRLPRRASPKLRCRATRISQAQHLPRDSHFEAHAAAFAFAPAYC
jgi:hypothetical protein